jgi:hypothetical protein
MPNRAAARVKPAFPGDSEEGKEIVGVGARHS